MNKSSRLVSLSEYYKIVDTIFTGYCGARPNQRVSLVIRVVAETGCKLLDALRILTKDCVKNDSRYVICMNGARYILSEDSSRMMNEQIRCNKGLADDMVFDLSARSIQRSIASVCDYLGLGNDICIKSFARLHQARCVSEAILDNDADSIMVNPGGYKQYSVPTDYKACDIIAGIYCIKCKVNGKLYIGESSNIIQRWHNHIRHLNGGVHKNAKLQCDYFKYGGNAFDFNILLICDDTAGRKAVESMYINAMSTIEFGYNIAA